MILSHDPTRLGTHLKMNSAKSSARATSNYLRRDSKRIIPDCSIQRRAIPSLGILTFISSLKRIACSSLTLVEFEAINFHTQCNFTELDRADCRVLELQSHHHVQPLSAYVSLLPANSNTLN